MALWAAGCGNDPAAPVSPVTTGRITVALDHEVDGVPLVFDQIRFTNEAGNRYSVTNLMYYISNVTLHRVDNESFHARGVHYRDAHVAATRSFAVDSIPNGEYDEISFVFGLDANQNVSDTLPLTQANLNMKWPEILGGGYHYMKIEGHYESVAGDTLGYATHTGKLYRQGVDPIPLHHFFTVHLVPVPHIIIHGDAWSVPIVMNLNSWYRIPPPLPPLLPVPPYDFARFDPVGAGIMTNVDAQAYLAQSGVNAFALGSITRTGP